jgi:hypothetical protein
MIDLRSLLTQRPHGSSSVWLQRNLLLHGVMGQNRAAQKFDSVNQKQSSYDWRVLRAIDDAPQHSTQGLKGV